jgi:hypothetical protein
VGVQSLKVLGFEGDNAVLNAGMRAVKRQPSGIGRLDQEQLHPASGEGQDRVTVIGPGGSEAEGITVPGDSPQQVVHRHFDRVDDNSQG